MYLSLSLYISLFVYKTEIIHLITNYKCEMGWNHYTSSLSIDDDICELIYGFKIQTTTTAMIDWLGTRGNEPHYLLL